MLFKELIIQGFKSISKPINIIFDEYSTGICFVTGENQAEPHLGANGVGKSTIWDALCWCLYGKDTIGLKASNIINWYSEEKCSVKVILVLRGELSEIVRTQSPNQILINDTSSTQEELDELLGINYQSFLHLVVIPQFSSKFFDLQPAEKLRIFSDILELDKWLEYSDRAREKANDINEKIDDESSDIDSLNGQIKQVEEEILNLASRGSRWEEQKQERLVSVEQEMDENESSRIPWQEQYSSAINALLPLQDEQIEADKLLKDIENLKEEQLKNIRTAERQRDSILFSLNQYKEDWDAFSQLEGKCPHCEQSITQQYLDKKLKEIEKKMERAKTLLEKRTGKLDNYNLELVEIKDKLKEAKHKLCDINSSISSLEKTADGFKTKLEKADLILGRLESKKLGIETESNPFEDMKNNAENQMKRFKQNRRSKKRNLKQLNIEYNIYKYWTKGFKEIRLFVIEEALLELELQINNNLEKLGLIDWKVELAVDHETKSGSIRKGFTVLIKSPKNEDLVPFVSFSGGEGQRLKIAGTLGLSDFISSRTGITPNIEIWDEATSWMSNEGVSDLVELLSDRAKDLSKTIFIVDHRDLNTYGEFENTLKIIKDEDGSRIDEW